MNEMDFTIVAMLIQSKYKTQEFNYDELIDMMYFIQDFRETDEDIDSPETLEQYYHFYYNTVLYLTELYELTTDLLKNTVTDYLLELTPKVHIDLIWKNEIDLDNIQEEDTAEDIYGNIMVRYENKEFMDVLEQTMLLNKRISRREAYQLARDTLTESRQKDIISDTTLDVSQEVLIYVFERHMQDMAQRLNIGTGQTTLEVNMYKFRDVLVSNSNLFDNIDDLGQYMARNVGKYMEDSSKEKEGEF